MINPMQLFQALRTARNPQQMFEQTVNQNPQLQNTFTQMKNSSNGASFEQMARQLAKQRGVSEEQLMQMYNQFGNKK
jgi:hypothetical protein